MSDLCPSCPTRLFSLIFRELGSEGVAREVEAAGCEWLWRTEWRDAETGQVKTRTRCGRAALPAWLEHFAAETKIASDAVQADRNEQARALQIVESVAGELGWPAVVQSLAQLGLRAGLGHRIAGELEGEGDR